MRFKASDLPPQYQEQIANAIRSAPSSPSRRHKYNAKATIVDGIKFPSKLHARCYEHLKLRRQAGDVLWFVREVAFDIAPGVRHRIDFLAALATGGFDLIEAKGRDLPDGRSRRLTVEH